MKRWIFLFMILLSLGGLVKRQVDLEASGTRYQVLKESRHAPQQPVAQEEGKVVEVEAAAEEQEEFLYSRHPLRVFLDINADFVGWIQVAGTDIDYPVVKGRDNQFYLDHDFYQEPSRAGAIFMDYRNIGGGTDAHTIVYGHYMRDGSMFQTLHRYRELSFFEEKQVIKLETFYGPRVYEVFSVYSVSAEDYQLSLSLSEEEIERWKDQSLHPSATTVSQEDKVLTLATCSYDVESGRLILHAVERKEASSKDEKRTP